MSYQGIAEDVQVLSEAAAVATATTGAFSSADLKGYHGVLVILDVGTYGSTAAEGSFKFHLEEAADNGSGSPGTFSDVDATFAQYHEAGSTSTAGSVTTTGIVIDSTNDDNTQYLMSYTGSKRHIRVALAATDSTGNGGVQDVKVWYLGLNPQNAPLH